MLKTERISKILLWVFPLVFFALSYQLPFWGDGIASVSKAAVRIYQEGLARPWNYPGSDPGHPTLFPWIIAFCWKIFGFYLWVPHLLIAIQLHLLCRILLTISGLSGKKSSIWLLLLLFISPLTVSQGLGISLQIPLTLTFFAAYYFLEKEKRGLAIFIICLMILVHLQAALLYFALIVFDFIKNRKTANYWQKLMLLSIPGWVFLAWGYFHYQEFGWAFFTPNYERAPPGFRTMIYNLGISAWRVMDLGYFIITLPAIYFLLKQIKDGKGNSLLNLGLITFPVLCIGIPLIFSYPPNHRYIFPVYLLSAVFFTYYIEQKSSKKWQSLWMSVAILLLISGNFWFYPGKCQGDQNLVHLEYHKLEKGMMNETGNAVIHSYAPLNNSPLYTYLVPERTLMYKDLYNCAFDTLEFILESNLNCEFSNADREILNRDFYVRSYEGNGVFLNLYLNKNFAHLHPNLAHNRSREKGYFEKKMEEMKKSLGR